MELSILSCIKFDFHTLDVIWWSQPAWCHFMTNFHPQGHNVHQACGIYCCIQQKHNDNIESCFLVLSAKSYLNKIELLWPGPPREFVGPGKIFYYLLKIIQKFWLVKSGGWNRHIRSVVAQIWSYDIIIEYWKHLYDLMTSH